MNGADILQLLQPYAATLREDLTLMNAGTIKLTVFGADVTVDHAARLKANLDRLEAILGACEGGDAPTT